MKHPPSHVFEFDPASLRQWCASRGMQAFRAEQILDWVYAKGVTDPADMTSLSKKDRDLLAQEMTFLSAACIAEQMASDGTRKLLLEWADASAPAVALNVLGGSTERQTECVMIPATSRSESGDEKMRRTACISSQVGCPVGCRFCASGIGGLDGNLSAGRIVEQVWRLGRLAPAAHDEGGRITNVVFMGMGEPLANFSAVMAAIRIISAPWGLGIGARRITLSTVGLPRAIERLAEECDVPVTLALSLHAPTDELRRELIPWANYSTIPDLLAACAKWFARTGREITLEYILLGGINDQVEHAEQLARLARTLRSNVNLIRYNEVAGMPFVRPRDDDVLAFQHVLRSRGVNAHIRASRGRDIAAACGQLRHEAVKSVGGGSG